MKLIIFKELKPKKGIDYTRDHLRRKCRDRTFPQPVSLSATRIAWVEEEIDDWLAKLAAAREPAAADPDGRPAWLRGDDRDGPEPPPPTSPQRPVKNSTGRRPRNAARQPEARPAAE